MRPVFCAGAAGAAAPGAAAPRTAAGLRPAAATGTGGSAWLRLRPGAFQEQVRQKTALSKAPDQDTTDCCDWRDVGSVRALVS